MRRKQGWCAKRWSGSAHGSESSARLPLTSGRTALDYANIVAEAETPLQEDELDRLCKSYEQAAGRTRESDTVLIDIDIVCHNGTVLRQADYVSPHFRTGLHLLSSSR